MVANPRLAIDSLTRTDKPAPVDLETLQAVWKELEAFIRAHSRTYTCPACCEPYQPVLFAVEHGLGCFAHPAVARARMAWDELVALNALAEGLGKKLGNRFVSPPPFNPSVPSLVCVGRNEEAPGPVFRHTLAADYAEALENVARLRPTSSARRRTLAEAIALLQVGVAEWEMYRDRDVTPCPGCGESVSLSALPAHLFGCERHPGHTRAAVLEDALEGIRGPQLSMAGKVIAEETRMRIGLVRLAGASRAFINGLSDSDIGKATVRPEKQALWTRAIKEAVTALEG